MPASSAQSSGVVMVGGGGGGSGRRQRGGGGDEEEDLLELDPFDGAVEQLYEKRCGARGLTGHCDWPLHLMPTPGSPSRSGELPDGQSCIVVKGVLLAAAVAAGCRATTRESALSAIVSLLATFRYDDCAFRCGEVK